MFVADLYLTLSYFVSFVHDYCDKLTNYRAIIQTYRAIIFKFSHLSRDNCNLSRHKFELSRENLRKKKKIAMSLTGHRSGDNQAQTNLFPLRPKFDDLCTFFNALEKLLCKNN